jgi:hypothetical protein
MPLHDWRDDRGWHGMQIIWQNQLLDWIQQQLPAGYRAYLGSVPALSIDIPGGRPDVGVRRWETPDGVESQATTDGNPEPDAEAVAVFELDPQTAVHIDFHGRLVAAIEIVSPRNKDRLEARERYLMRYLGYVRQGVHLMLIDVLPRPVDFSFADAINANLRFAQPACPVPFVVNYRVGEAVPEGTLVGWWRRSLEVGSPLPIIPLALTVRESISIDLEHTYRESARRVYLD